MANIKDKDAEALLQKYVEGKCTLAEKAIVESWFLEETAHLQGELEDVDHPIVKRKIWKAIDRENQGTSIQRLRWSRYAVAASLVLLAAFGFYFLNRYASTFQSSPRGETTVVGKPGKYAATIVLGNGKKILLTDEMKGELYDEAGIQIVKAEKGKVVYKAISDKAQSAFEYNTLKTSTGEQFQLILPDGTNVWLNSASSLTFPNNFSNQTARVVELNGEAYFEVAKDANHPFLVKSGAHQVEVLGTHFNVNAYTDENQIKTTLLEGRVKIADTILKPGQQSIFGQQGLRVLDVDTETAVAWKNGYFKFKDERLDVVMRKLSRWYNVEVVYQGPISDEGFNGTISQFNALEDVLEMLEKTKAVQFKLEGRRVTVMR